jgi:hypothetical protein
MASRRDEPDSVKKERAAPAAARTPKTPARKTAAPRRKPSAKDAAAAAQIETPEPPAPHESQEPRAAAGPKGLLRAGLKALGTVRDDVVKHQTNVIESLLGIGKTDPAGGKGGLPRAFPGLDTFGIRKFEDVFDQRVAAALERLGMPSAQDVQELREQVRLLREQIARMESARRKR